MYDILKELMNTPYYYGPVAETEVFDCPITHNATKVNGVWYLGTLDTLPGFEAREIKAPVAPV
jgi:hypothetical protein